MKTVEDIDINGIDNIKIKMPRDDQNTTERVNTTNIQIEFTPQKRIITPKAIKDTMNFQLDNMGANAKQIHFDKKNVKQIIIEELDKDKEVDNSDKSQEEQKE